MEKSKVLFLCGLYPPESMDFFYKNSRRGYQFAAQNLQYAFVKGFYENGCEITVLSIPFISTFPFGFKKLFIPSYEINIDGRYYGNTFGYINLPLLKKPKGIFKFISKWIKTHGQPYVFIYSLDFNLFKIGLKIKRLYPGTIVIPIIPDLPEFMGTNIVYKLFCIKKFQDRFIKHNINRFDGFVVLSEEMINYFDVRDKKYEVVEGIYNAPHIVKKIFHNSNKDRNVFMYAGGINFKYGIIELLNSFSEIKGDDLELWICGFGDAVDVVKEYAKKDGRIIYYGGLPHSEILKLQSECSFLINPRNPNKDFTNYSFPSKTLEYMASGKPTIMYALPTMPKEYLNYIIEIKDNGIDGDGIIRAMKRAILLNNHEYLELGESARRFITMYKNPKSQVRKVLNKFQII